MIEAILAGLLWLSALINVALWIAYRRAEDELADLHHLDFGNEDGAFGDLPGPYLGAVGQRDPTINYD